MIHTFALCDMFLVYHETYCAYLDSVLLPSVLTCIHNSNPLLKIFLNKYVIICYINAQLSEEFAKPSLKIRIISDLF